MSWTNDPAKLRRRATLAARAEEKLTCAPGKVGGLLKQGWAQDESRQLKTKVALIRPKMAVLYGRDLAWSLIVDTECDQADCLEESRPKALGPSDDTNPSAFGFVDSSHRTAMAGFGWNPDWDDGPGLEAVLDRFSSLADAAIGEFDAKVKPHNWRKARFLIRTDRSWTQGEDDAARQHGFALLDLEQAKYYQGLARRMGKMARLQILTACSSADEEVRTARKVEAIRATIHHDGQDLVYYAFCVPVDEILPLITVHRREDPKGFDKNREGYQRKPAKPRLQQIQAYADVNGALFPNSIVVNLRVPDDQPLRFTGHSDNVAPHAGQAGTLFLPRQFGSMAIIDGQHRLMGLYETEASRRDAVPVVAFEGLAPDLQRQLFLDINGYQRKVPPGERQQQFADIWWDSKKPDERLQALISRIVHRLNEDDDSPLRDSVKTGDELPDDKRPVTYSTLFRALNKLKLVGSIKDGSFRPGVLGEAHSDWRNRTLTRATEALKVYLSQFEHHCKEIWFAGSNPGGYLRKSDGIAALLDALSLTLRADAKNLGDISKLPRDVLNQQIKKRASTMAVWFATLSPDEVAAIRANYGAAGQRRTAMKFLAAINREDPEFQPEVLQNFLAETSEERIQETSELVRELREHLRNTVHKALQDRYGESESKWWRGGFSAQTRAAIGRRRELSDDLRPLLDAISVKEWVQAAKGIFMNIKDDLGIHDAKRRSKDAQLAWATHLADAEEELKKGQPQIKSEVLDALCEAHQRLIAPDTES